MRQFPPALPCDRRPEILISERQMPRLLHDSEPALTIGDLMALTGHFPPPPVRSVPTQNTFRRADPDICAITPTPDCFR
jgi:hypothetical protein